MRARCFCFCACVRVRARMWLTRLRTLPSPPRTFVLTTRHLRRRSPSLPSRPICCCAASRARSRPRLPRPPRRCRRSAPSTTRPQVMTRSKPRDESDSVCNSRVHCITHDGREPLVARSLVHSPHGCPSVTYIAAILLLILLLIQHPVSQCPCLPSHPRCTRSHSLSSFVGWLGINSNRSIHHVLFSCTTVG